MNVSLPTESYHRHFPAIGDLGHALLKFSRVYTMV